MPQSPLSSRKIGEQSRQNLECGHIEPGETKPSKSVGSSNNRPKSLEPACTRQYQTLLSPHWLCLENVRSRATIGKTATEQKRGRSRQGALSWASVGEFTAPSVGPKMKYTPAKSVSVNTSRLNPQPCSTLLHRFVRTNSE
jgi:hypothetical protein